MTDQQAHSAEGAEAEKTLSFSLLIPTRNRQRTAIAAIESAVNCGDPLLQIVVSDNSDDDRLRDMIRDSGWTRRVEYQKTDRFLSMRDNWEFALDRAQGDYVAVIGDDDAVVPDCFLWARSILPRLDVDVLQCGYAVYKWDDYLFPGRRNYLSMRFGQEIVKYADPRIPLRGAVNYNPRVGTGPGLYYGFVRREFLERLRGLRGRWIVDPVPDFDSGYATLMHARSFAQSERCVFVSGHSKASNSGSFRSAVSFRASMRDMDPDNPSGDAMFLPDELGLRANRAVIVSCQLRMLGEIRRALGDPQADINREAAWSYMADELSRGYETVSFPLARAALESLAERWNLMGRVELPRRRALSSGLVLEQGPKRPPTPPELGEEEDRSRKHLFDRLVVNGNTLGFGGILDAVRFVASLQRPLQQSGYPKMRKAAFEFAGDRARRGLSRARRLMEDGEAEAALGEAEAVLLYHPHSVAALSLAAEALLRLERWDDAETRLSQALTVAPGSMKLLEDYSDVLVRLGCGDLAQAIVEERLSRDEGSERLRSLRSKLAAAAAAAEARIKGDGAS